MKDNQEEIINRIKYLIEEEHITRNKFADRIGIDPSNLSKHLNGKLPINDSLLNKIVVNLGVSKQWLSEGDDIPFAKKPLGIREITLSDDKIIQYGSGTPVYDVDVTAGPLERSAMFTRDNLMGVIDLPSIDPGSRVVKVSGNSMESVIMNGDLLAVSELTNPSIIFWGQIYVVLLDDYRMVKYLRRHPDSDRIILRSENPQYDDIDIRRSDIRELMLVKNIIHIESRM